MKITAILLGTLLVLLVAFKILVGLIHLLSSLMFACIVVALIAMMFGAFSLGRLSKKTQ
jgi:hypothetical protein